MQKLLEGAVKFRKQDFEVYRELFKDLKKEQKPHTLFISCSDSRIDSHLITGTLPGELFVIRNIGNMVPPFRETTEYVATRAAIEYAVIVLEVENIIVCGHSNCGGCAACLNSSKLPEGLTHTKKWLELAHSVRDRVLEEIPEEESKNRERMMEKFNVVQQLKHLATYPYIQQKVAEGKLVLSGWYYVIETGEIFVYDKDTGEFVLP